MNYHIGKQRAVPLCSFKAGDRVKLISTDISTQRYLGSTGIIYSIDLHFSEPLVTIDMDIPIHSGRIQLFASRLKLIDEDTEMIENSDEYEGEW